MAQGANWNVADDDGSVMPGRAVYCAPTTLVSADRFADGGLREIMNPNASDFSSGVVAPFECLKEGWTAIKDQYWLFLGLALVAMLIGGAVPIVLIGPMMCGLYLCLFRKMRGQPVEFGDLFKGFDYFVQGLVAAAIQTVPIFIVLVPTYAIFFAFSIATLPHDRS